jgi:5S rRNA maturation endonuclease (ribonuclease M5)
LGVPSAVYDYRDEQHRLLYQVCRFVPKTFRPRRPDGRGGWHWGYGNVRRVLYRLTEVLEAPIVCVTEGEKDAECLRDHGFVATTNAGGSDAAWLPDYTTALRGRQVILIPDNDPPGQSRVLRIARSLLGEVAHLSILNLEGVKDVSQWFDQGHSDLEFMQLLEAEHAVRR